MFFYFFRRQILRAMLSHWASTYGGGTQSSRHCRTRNSPQTALALGFLLCAPRGRQAGRQAAPAHWLQRQQQCQQGLLRNATRDESPGREFIHQTRGTSASNGSLIDIYICLHRSASLYLFGPQAASRFLSHGVQDLSTGYNAVASAAPPEPAADTGAERTKRSSRHFTGKHDTEQANFLISS